MFRQQTKSPKAEGVRNRPILKTSAEAHQNTPAPFRRKSPAESVPKRPARADFPPAQKQALRTPRHGLRPAGSPQRRGHSPRCVETDACSPCSFMPLGIPRKNSPVRKTSPRSPPLATAANRRTPFGALPHFDKTPRSAARGPAVTPAVAAPSFRSDLAPESAAGRIVQP